MSGMQPGAIDRGGAGRFPEIGEAEWPSRSLASGTIANCFSVVQAHRSKKRNVDDSPLFCRFVLKI
ncbi:MAG TPA: hypothetical protein IAB50_09825 [Candidatus Faecivicinus avistercoris]|nr:hypothetical protein [Candidatus Faecivicinus avistercoris]